MALDLYELAIRFKSEGFAAVNRDLDTLDKKGKGIGKAFSLLKASLIVGAVGGFIRKIAVESIEAQKQTAQLNAVLKSTGGIAGVTAGDIDKMAGSLQKTTVFSDEAVKSSAALLLTFTNIRGEIFKNTLPAITDMATALGTDLNSATLQVGKALQDPVRGITALRRAGVSFSEAQQAVIKNLVATNRLAEAQGIILKELTVQFGGSAEAARNTLGGALAGLSNAWGDLFEVTQDSSKGIVGAINSIADALPNARAKIDTAFGGLVKWIKEVEARMARLQGIAFSINRFFGGNAQAVGVGSTCGGGGGGRDNGPGMLPGVVVNAPSKVLPPFGGGGTGTGPKIPGFGDFDSASQARIDQIGNMDSVPVPGIGMSVDTLDELFKNFNKNREARSQEALDAEIAELEKRRAMIEGFGASLADTIRTGLGDTLGDAIYNAFSAAFNGESLGGIFAAFGKTVLAGVGAIFTQMGQQYIAYGVVMAGLVPSLTNPFTAGPAAIAIGAALVAMGAALGAIGKGGGGRGTSAAGAFRNPSGTSDIVRLKFVDRPGASGSLSAAPSIVFNVIGPNDPKAQRAIGEIVRKNSRRET